MISFDPTDSLTAFTVEGSNSTFVASYGNNANTSYLRVYANSQSNAGYILGASNGDAGAQPCFVLGQVVDNNNIAAPDMVIRDHKIGYGGNVSPAFTVDITGDLNISGGFYKNSNYYPVDAWAQAVNTTGVYNNSRVGIGTATPLRPLHVVTGATSIAHVYGEAAVLNGSLSIMHGINDGFRFMSALDNSMTASTSRYMSFGKTIGANNQAELSYTHVADYSANNYLGLGLYGGTYVSVTGAGNIGIGTMAPVSKLSVAGGSTIGVGYSNVTASSNTLLVCERIGIGTTAPMASFHTTSDAIVGSLRAYGEIVSFSDMSDIALKENFMSLDSIDNTLEKMKRLIPVEFNWRKDIFYKERAGTRDVGLIAQAVEKEFPHVVGSLEAPAPGSSTDSCMSTVTYKTVRYEKLVPYLIQAVKQLTARIEALEARGT
jgi:hypothetical protein